MTNSMINKDIKKKLEDYKKDRVSITLSKGLLNRIENFKKQNQIETLSPLIEIMLNQWLDIQDKKLNKSDDESANSDKETRPTQSSNRINDSK